MLNAYNQTIISFFLVSFFSQIGHLINNDTGFYIGMGLSVIFMILMYIIDRKKINLLLETIPICWACFWTISSIVWLIIFVILESNLGAFNKFSIIIGDCLLYMFLWIVTFDVLGTKILSELENITQKAGRK